MIGALKLHDAYIARTVMLTVLATWGVLLGLDVVMAFAGEFGEIGKGEFGTYYIGYSRTPSVTERMLDNMFIGDPPGNTDAILDFSTAVTGCMFYVATDAFLDDPLPFAGADSVPSSPEPCTDSAPSAQGGSLSIGSLKGQN